MEKYPWWSDAQKKLADEAQSFVDRLVPLAQEDAWNRRYPWRIAKEIGKKGWYGAIIPQRYGGHSEEWGVTGACILCEELGRLRAVSNDYINTMCSGGAHMLNGHGTEEQKRRLLPRIATGELHTSVAITEPFAGSDAGSVETQAVAEGNFYVLNGKKRFIMNAGAAGIHMTYARTSSRPEDIKRRKHLSVFVVAKGTPGFSIEKINELTGYDGLYDSYLNFDHVKVPLSDRIAGEGDGWSIMMAGLNVERTVAAATSLGGMREALSYASFHLERRVQFGHPTVELPTNQFKLADMITSLNMSRLLTYYTAYLFDLGGDSALYPAMLKLNNTEELMRDFVLNAIQCMGGDGVTKFYPVERIMRDAKINETAAGSSDIMRMLIYRQGLKQMADDLKVPRRVMDKILKIPMPIGRAEDLPKYRATEEGVLEALAENYRVNPGLHMTVAELQAQIPAPDEDIIGSLVSLEGKGLARLHRSGKGAVNLARATYEGLAKAHPADYYKYRPTWAVDEVF
ncbi:MAG: acyl-CoA/acyl-ACP dehydrogenase [Deltaproteobacteria bacterium]|nr:acyl-CoA/acyl-ACP dehydrogenase [Deltaproteobacteria bacterium]